MQSLDYLLIFNLIAHVVGNRLLHAWQSFTAGH